MAEREFAPRQYIDPKSGLPIRHEYRLPNDPDLEDVPDPRGPEGNQFAGRTPFPEVLGDQKHDPRFLPDPDIEDLSVVMSGRELIAAVSAEDQTILAFDNELSTMHATLRRLRQKAERMAQSVSKQDENKGQGVSSTSHAQNVVQMISTILEPWFMALDDEFSKLLNLTDQGQALEEAEQ
jgi:hypothetical protein